jgi:serine/threonine protein kinase
VESQYPPARRPSDRAQLDSFELLSAIGRGPRAEVWHARTRSGRDVALKLFHPHLCKNASFVARFEKETAALAALSHPNALAALDRGRAGDRFYVVTERMTRGSLADLRGEPVSPDLAARIALEICEVLDYAHRRGLPHRNLVPENVFIDARDRVRVSDFGLSLLSTGAAADGDARADLHALGALLQLMVYGTRSTDGHAARERHVSPRLLDVLGRALAARAADRFGRASEMALALRLAAATPARDAEPRAASEALAYSVDGNVVSVTLSPEATPDAVRDRLAQLERLLTSGGPWRVAYDLGSVRILDDGVRMLLERLHARVQRNVERVGFCSPRALVRATALMLGGSLRGVNTRSFAAAGPMYAWLGREDDG